MPLYSVKAAVWVVFQAEDDEDAAFYAEDHAADEVREGARFDLGPIRRVDSLADLPGKGWADSLPWGGDGKRTVRMILAARTREREEVSDSEGSFPLVAEASEMRGDAAGAHGLSALLAAAEAKLAEARAETPPPPDRVALWSAINAYAVACAGEPDRFIYGNTARMVAVRNIEKLAAAEPREAALRERVGALALEWERAADKWLERYRLAVPRAHDDTDAARDAAEYRWHETTCRKHADAARAALEEAQYPARSSRRTP